MPNITFKDLNCQTYLLDIDDSLTVKELKEKLHEKRGLDYSADQQVRAVKYTVLYLCQRLDCYVFVKGNDLRWKGPARGFSNKLLEN